MSLILTGNSSTLTVDSTNGISFPNGSGSQGARAKVLQVVQTYYKTLVTTTSATWAATGVTASITPTFANSSIFVMVNIAASGTTDTYGGFRLYRNGSLLTDASSNQSPGTPPNTFIPYTQRSGDSQYQLQNYAQNYLDSPANTSAQTYTIYWAKTYGTAINLNSTYFIDSGNTYTNYAPSSITLMEIAA